MSKKLLSILLCVLMVITSISCLFTMSASAVGILNKELISYGNVDDLGDDAPVKLNSLQSTNLSDVAAKHANKWYRASGGVALGTDLDSTGAVWTIDSSETFPTQFGANAQVVVDPTNANNKALRVVQNLHQFIDADEIYWLRYFRSEKRMSDMYCDMFMIPVPGALLPVLAFMLLGFSCQNIFLIVFSIILGIGHIGIHLNHKREADKQ